MRALGYPLSELGCAALAIALASACSVFPEEAVLPFSGAAGAGGSGSAGMPAVDGGVPSEAGRAGSSAAGSGGVAGGSLGGSSLGGSATGGSASGSESGGGGLGQAGAGGSPTEECADAQELTVRTGLDLWIGAADPSATHGGEKLLYVSGGTDERRAVFELTVPAAPAGVELLEAVVELTLESNADASKAARQLGLHLLMPLRAVDELNANWNRFGRNNGAANRWETPGGDLSELVTQTDIPADTASGVVRFDVTEALRSVLSPEASVYGIVVLERGSVPMAPAALAFTSREGNASRSAALLIRYCPS